MIQDTMTIREVADYLRLAYPAARRMARRGEFGTLTVVPTPQKHFQIRGRGLQRFLEEHAE